jgi:hypothetical protein
MDSIFSPLSLNKTRKIKKKNLETQNTNVWRPTELLATSNFFQMHCSCAL